MPTRVVQVATLAVNAERLMGADATSALVRSRSAGARCRRRSSTPSSPTRPRARALGATDSLWDAVIAAEPAPVGVPGRSRHRPALAALARLRRPQVALPGRPLPGCRRPGRARPRARSAWTSRTRPGRPGRLRARHRPGRRLVRASGAASRPLRPDEWERVRMHPYHTHQVLARTPVPALPSDVASCHHERLDGSGYYRGLPRSGAVGAGADPRGGRHLPHQDRAPAAPRGALARTTRPPISGRRRRRAGWTPRPSRPSWPRPGSRRPAHAHAAAHRARDRDPGRGGARRLDAGDRPGALDLSPKTVDGHLQRIYPKIGVSTGPARRSTPSTMAAPAQRPEEGENSP